MATPKPAPKPQNVKILRDGVFVGDGIRADKNDIVEGLAPDVIKVLCETGLARVVQ